MVANKHLGIVAHGPGIPSLTGNPTQVGSKLSEKSIKKKVEYLKSSFNPCSVDSEVWIKLNFLVYWFKNQNEFKLNNTFYCWTVLAKLS